MKDDRKNRTGIVYSTNPNYTYEKSEQREQELLLPEKQLLYIELDRKQRSGKTVTLISGFIGPEASLLDLAKALKQHCATGGSAKGGEIFIQGDFREKVMNYLLSKKYKVKRRG